MATERVDTFTAIAKKSEIYSDFLTDLVPHPDTGELVRNTNESSVVRAIRNLVMTNKYERLMQPNLCGNVQKLLFEPMGPDTAEIIKTTISEGIRNYEPRARLQNVFVEANEDQQYYRVTIVFYIINKQEPITANITLQRVR